MSDLSIITGQKFRHRQRGTTYEAVGLAAVQAATTVPIGEGTVMVIYRGEDGQLHARRLGEFMDGRFERVTEEG